MAGYSQIADGIGARPVYDYDPGSTFFDAGIPVGPGVFNIMDFGAIAGQNVDNRPMIQAAIEAAADTGGGVVYIPPGIFGIAGDPMNEGAVQVYSNVFLKGAGMGQSTLRLVDGSSGDITGLVRSPWGEETTNWGVSDLSIDGNQANTTGKVDGFFTGPVPGQTIADSDVYVARVEIMEVSRYGFDPHELTQRLSINDSVAHNNGVDGFVFDRIAEGEISGNVSYDNARHGFNVVTTSEDLVLTNNVSHDNGGAGFALQRGSENIQPPHNIVIEGGASFGNGREGVLVQMAREVAVSGMDVHDNGMSGVRLLGAESVIIENNQVHDNSQSQHDGFSEVELQNFQDTVFNQTYDATGNTVSGNTIFSQGPVKSSYGIEVDDTIDPQANTIIAGSSITGTARGATLLTSSFYDREISGSDFDDTIIGTNGIDYITAGAGDDQIKAQDGNDIVFAGDGDDTVLGGKGNDELHGANGDDTLKGSSGVDKLYGEAGNDTLRGGNGNDLLNGGAGDDDLSGGKDNDGFFGGGGNDYIKGDSGNDTAFGDGGDDILIGGSGLDTLYGGSGRDTLKGGSGDDKLFGGNDDDVLKGNSGNDRVFGDSGNDQLFGQKGNDILDGGLGNDSISGGSGNDTIFASTGLDTIDGDGGYDTLDFSNITAGVDINASSKQASGPVTTSFDSIERFIGSDFADTFRGSDKVNTFEAGAGNDTIRSAGGADVLTGGQGDDTYIYFARDVVDGNGVNRGVDTITDYAQGDIIDVRDIAKGDANAVSLSVGSQGVTVSALIDGTFQDVAVLGGVQDVNSVSVMIDDGLFA